jgi:hypothetical protein
MPKLTPEQRAELEAQLAADDDGDDDFDFHYAEGDRSISLPWSKRESLAELGFKVPARKPAAAPKPGGAQEPKGRNVSVFGPRNRSTGG